MSEKVSLPIQCTDARLRLAGEKSPDSTLATGSVEVNGSLAIRIRVLKSKSGPFVKMPNFRIGQGEDASWCDYVVPVGEHGAAIRQHINDYVLKEYNHKVEMAAEEATTEAATETAEATAEAGDDSPFDTEE